MIDIFEPEVEHGSIKLAKVRSNLTSSLKNPDSATNRLFKSIQKLKDGDVPLRLFHWKKKKKRYAIDHFY